MINNNCSGKGLLNLLKDKGPLKGLEIGCAEGDTSSFLLENLPELHLIGVDPYTDYIDWNGNNLNSRQKTYEDLIERLSIYNRFDLIRKTSDDGAEDVANESLDFIFIDGVHTYEQVKKDCENYYSKLKPGGLFSGHDYNTISEVKKAVDEFAKAQDKKQIFLTDIDVWYHYK